ncbi:hypothetical protein [Enterobacter sp. NFIX58]|uniref:hypothetical protein n=1 Tax=Enterobacter sp. NFIX58 TaxID=1566251 RepID=UPI001C31C4C5|nr:hypothetical protein [Enterobacter sp. NFIX58]
MNRYDVMSYSLDVDGNSGPFVKYEDYAALEQKLAESQREFRAADATIENLQMQVEKLAAENAVLKSKGRELLTEACSVYEKFNAIINSEDGDFIDGQTLHEFQFVLDCETPATDAFLAEVRAQGVEMFAAHKRERQQALRSRSMRMSEEAAGMAADAEDFADELRKGGATEEGQSFLSDEDCQAFVKAFTKGAAQ